MEIKIGEVTESTTTGFVAECYELYNLPPFGSLVKTVDPPVEIYGIVCQAGTASIEPGRRPIARGKDETSEAEIYTANPQLLKLLHSEFHVLSVGYSESVQIRQYLPARPARIHAFVYPCTPEEVKKFSGSFDFLNLLLAPDTRVPAEELIGAALREMSRAQDDPRAFLVAAGKALAPLLGGEYNRLKSIMARIH
jgi:hypothetical protein